MVRNLALKLCYDGSNYHGWQFQRNAVSVAGTLKRELETLFGHPVNLLGCGRTDAGVHARCYIANFRTSQTGIPPHRVPVALNGLLPPDITVLDAWEAPWDFHAINSCERKEYTYELHLGPVRDAFLSRSAYHYAHPFDVEHCRRAAEAFVGRHDFAAVRNMGTDVRSTVRTVYHFRVEQEGLRARLSICADGFLYNMARNLVGTVLYVNEGKISDPAAVLRAADRRAAGPTLPPHALYLTRLWYEGGAEYG
jgi:tRNA pseudouridine38-40 synthase